MIRYAFYPLSVYSVPHRNQSLDVLRAIAVLMVIGHHYPYYDFWTYMGLTGVDLFFVLSGYLISGLLFQDLQQTGEIHVGRFLMRRGLKIYPAYYVMILFFLPFTLHSVTWADFTFMGAYYPALWGHGWSLSVEEHFYLLFPLALVVALRCFKSKRHLWIPVVAPILLLVCLALRYRFAATHDIGLGIAETHLRIDTIFAGVALGWCRYFGKRQLRVSHAWAYWVLGCLLLVPRFSGRFSALEIATVGYTTLTLGFALLLIAALNTPWMNSPVLQPVARLGVYSYSVYLWHFAIAKFFAGVLPRSFVSFWVYIAVSFGVGIGAAKIVELPVLRIRERFFPSFTKRAENHVVQLPDLIPAPVEICAT